MPERNFEIQWPDGTTESCYSPSSTIENYLTTGKAYALEEFLSITNTALNEASERVRQKYGFACSSAMDQLNKIQQGAKQHQGNSNANVVVLKIS